MTAIGGYIYNECLPRREAMEHVVSQAYPFVMSWLISEGFSFITSGFLSPDSWMGIGFRATLHSMVCHTGMHFARIEDTDVCLKSAVAQYLFHHVFK